MVAYCGGGDSRLRQGMGQVVVTTSAAVEAIIAEAISGPLAIAVAPLIAGETYELTNICSFDPPADPGITLQDVTDALQFSVPSTSIPAILKLKQWFLRQYWIQVCECVSVPTPPLPPISAPTGVGVNSGAPSGVVVPCWTNTISKDGVFVDGSGINPAQYVDITDMFPGTQTITARSPTTDRPNVQAKVLQTPLPVSLSARWTGTSPAADFPFLRWDFYDSAGNFVDGMFGPTFDHPSTWDVTQTRPTLVTGAYAVHAELQIGAIGFPIGQHWTSSVQLSYACAGVNGPTTPCCPPDPNLDIRLTQITQLLYQILAEKTQQTAYVDGPRHAGLSGDGSIAINPASRAIRVEVNTDLSNWPHHEQQPDYFFSLGFVTPSAVGTPLKGVRLVYDRQTFSWPTYTDLISYSLSPAINVDLVELL